MPASRIDMMLANVFLTRQTTLFCDWFGILSSQRASLSYSSSFAATGYYLVVLFPLEGKQFCARDLSSSPPPGAGFDY